MTSLSKNPFVSVVLLAGGLGTRMGAPIPKQFIPLGSMPLALHSFHTFAALACVGEIIVVCDIPHRIHFPDFASPRIHFALPGERRQDSVWNGLCTINEHADLVCIHDSARPFLHEDDLLNVIVAAQEHNAAALAIPVKQTIKKADVNGFVEETLDRSQLWEMHTPQVITPHLLRKGFEVAAQTNATVTDDASLVELLGLPVKLVKGNDRNLKVTTPTDLAFSEVLLKQMPS